jgi:predicted outer membrane protein
VAVDAQQGGNLQGYIANCLILGNEEEIALSQFAAEKAQNPKVKQFAQKMVQEHTQFNQKLQQFATEQVSLTEAADVTGRQTTTTTTSTDRQPDRATTPGQADRAQPDRAARSVADRDPASPGAERDANAPRATTTRETETQYTSVRSGASPDQLFALQKEAAQHCLSMTKQELSQAQGEEFDKAYMGTQMGMHIGMLAKLKAAEGHVSGEFQQLIQQAQQTTMQHKQEAEQIKKELASASGGATGNRERQQNR